MFKLGLSICFMLMVFIPNKLHSKGLEGYYTLSGTMYSKETKETIKNTVFILNGDSVKTDDKGNFSFQVKWRNICGFRLNFLQKIKANKKANPEHIIFTFNNSENKIRNKWKKYGLWQYEKKHPKPYFVKMYW